MPVIYILGFVSFLCYLGMPIWIAVAGIAGLIVWAEIGSN